eukprot:g805.t1
MSTVRQKKVSSVAIAEKAKTYLKDVFLRFRSQSRVGEGKLLACKCMWPEITGDGASAEQPCPPPPIKCEICMNAVNAVRYGSHPINYCGNTPSILKFYDFCVQAGEQMSGIYMDVHDVIVQLTKRFGEEYGASGEICAELGCCMEKPGHTPLPPPPVRVEGCMDSEAENYNPEAEIEDGSCKFPLPLPIKGCMNSDATNYNAEATEDDGSCQLPVKGCMDANAKNFNKKATQDDGSCEDPKPDPKPDCEQKFKHWLKQYKKGDLYDCNDNCRARKDGHKQYCIDKTLETGNAAFGGKNVKIIRNWDDKRGCCTDNKCGKDIKWERYFDIYSGPAWTWDCYDNCRAREEHSQKDIDACLPELIGQTWPRTGQFTMKINTINRDWDKKKGCCADGCPPNLHKWWLYHRGRTQQWHWDCSDVRHAVGSPRMVASGEKTTVPCINRLIRCAIVGKRTGEESRKKPARKIELKNTTHKN